MKKVTLIKSLIGAKPNQKATAASLGLKKLGDSIVLSNDAATLGKVTVLRHLVKVETI
jgi:large subunit ribosomal protein L30